MEFRNNSTICSQIVEYVQKKIFSGAYACGQRLPAIRDFAVTCRVNPNTIVRAYAQLEEEKLIYTDSTNGKFVTADAALIASAREKFLLEKVAAFAQEVRGAGAEREELARMIGEALSEEE